MTNASTPSGQDLTRRVALRGLAAGAGAAAVTAAVGGTAFAAAPTPLSAGPSTPSEPAGNPTPGVMQLFDDPGFNFTGLLALGAAGYGSSEVGEVLTAVNAINAAGLSNQTYTDTFRSWGRRLAKSAAAAGAREQTETQRAQAIRASQYYAQALFYVLGTDDPGAEENLYWATREQWDTFARQWVPAALQTTVNWGKVKMPVWLFRPDTSGRPRPTVILTNGSDGQNVDMWTYGVPAALARGWNALVYDGPGQGQMLFVNQIPFTRRWDHVVTPLVNWLTQRSDVDHRRIALTGLSMGGDLVGQAAAFEHRIAALASMPGCLSPWLAFPPEVREILKPTKAETNRYWNEEIVPTLTPELAFPLKKRFEPFDPAVMRAARQGRIFTDFWTPAQAVIALDITNVVPQIQCPTLVLDYDDEQFYPGQPREMYNLLRSPKKYIKLTRAQGAQLHCSPMAPQTHCETVFDWLDRTLHV
ncbi:alpha/beta hydrolase family protein [Streptomyces sp. NPDC048639]|uniref:alpha/beta hydrolase family protein n=1 Tax=Streptomyces sp. NPDC048639 TaxID=3365581 RepID=UPI00371F42B1